MAEQFDVCVIGAGPGGYVAAIRAAQLGLKTAIVEREHLGGVCLNVGCIPSKALISASHLYQHITHNGPEMGFQLSGPIGVDWRKLQAWKQTVCNKMAGGVGQLLKGNNVTIFTGEAKFVSTGEIEICLADESGKIPRTGGAKSKLAAKNFIIATGSRPIEIPGFGYDGQFVLSSTHALALAEPVKRLLVIGGGYIGLEIGSMMAGLGSEVVVLEAGSRLLSEAADPECVQVVERKLKKKGVQVEFAARAQAWAKKASGIEVTAEVAGKQKIFGADKVLVTVGRLPNSGELNLAAIGVVIDEKGFIKTNAQRRTSVANIWAIGDVACQPMLAHKASHEGVLVAEVIAGKNRVFDAKVVPAIIFVEPEIASAGWTEEECRARGHNELRVGKFPFGANGRAVSLMETDGFVKIIADQKTNIVLGVHIVGPDASNLISEAALAIEMGARLEDLALTIHPHPTLGETMMEAAEAALGHAIHVIHKPLGSQSRSSSASRVNA